MENKNVNRAVIGVLALLVVLLGGYIAVSHLTGAKTAPAAGPTGASSAAVVPMEEYQAQYVKPETPIDRSKNVTLPGWAALPSPQTPISSTRGSSSTTRPRISGTKTG